MRKQAGRRISPSQLTSPSTGKRALQLSRETIRTLRPDELELVGGAEVQQECWTTSLPHQVSLVECPTQRVPQP